MINAALPAGKLELFRQYTLPEPGQLNDEELTALLKNGMLSINKHHLILTNSLIYKTESEFLEDLRLYKTALLNHLKLTSKELYMELRDSLENDLEKKKISMFESETTLLNTKLSALLLKCQESGYSHKRYFVKSLDKMNSSINQRFEAELRFLVPFLREKAMKKKRALHTFSQNQRII